MSLASSTYYYKPSERKEKRDEELRDKIIAIQKDAECYGYRRIKEQLLKNGERVNEKRIRRVMNRYKLESKSPQRKHKYVNSVAVYRTFPNLIKGMAVRDLNQVWVTDITYIKVAQRFVYLAAILDLYSRLTVGWSLSETMGHYLCLSALKSALAKRNPGAGCIHHSDQGTQYTSQLYVQLLKRHGFQISMSAKARPTENAFIESFFKTLKYEEVHLKNYKTLDDVRKNIPRFIEEVYNRKRLHSSIGYRSPEEFEETLKRINPADRPVQKVL
jgi:transposase InsO family protein